MTIIFIEWKSYVEIQYSNFHLNIVLLHIWSMNVYYFEDILLYKAIFLWLRINDSYVDLQKWNMWSVATATEINCVSNMQFRQNFLLYW